MNCCVIYKITDLHNKCYIGSTIDFHRRKLEHKRRNLLKLTKPYSFEIIRKFQYKFIKVRYLLETWYILQNDCINKNRPIINTRKEVKIYFNKNRKQILKNNEKRNSTIITCECGYKLRKDSLKRHLRNNIHKKRLNQIHLNK